MLKLPSHFLRQHGSKIRDGLVVLKLVSPNPNPNPKTLTLTPKCNPDPNPDPNQRCTHCAWPA